MASCLFAVVVALATTASAEISPAVPRSPPAPAAITLDRSPGAEACADVAELATEVHAITGHAVLDPTATNANVTVAVRVTPMANRPGFEASIKMSGDITGERTLSDSGPGCDVLTQAIAVSIALSLEPRPLPRRAPPQQVESPPVEPSPPPTLTVSLGGYYDFGVLSDAAAGLLLGLDVVIPIVSFGLAFMTLPEDTREETKPPLVYRYFGGRARACTRQPLLELFGASLCLDVLIGERRARIIDDETSEISGLFVAVGPQLEVCRRVVGPFGIYAELELAVPVYQDSIGVRGTTIRSPEQPVTFQMGLGTRFWIDTGPE